MKIKRSSKCSLKYANQNKLKQLDVVLIEYANVVNHFIDLFWNKKLPRKAELLKPIVDSPESWLSARLRKVAARESIDMIKSSIEKAKTDKKDPVKPIHRGKRMCVSSTIASLLPSKKSTKFDCWLKLTSIGNKIKINIPLKLHKHFNKLSKKGKRLESYVVTKESIQFCFEINTGEKQKKDKCIGIDTGINALASTSNRKQYGTDFKNNIERVKRCKHGSKGQKKAIRALRQKIDEIAKEIVKGVSLVVVESLKGITKGTKLKRRLSKNIRRSIGKWNVRYWLTRLQWNCEETNVSFRTVSPWKTSQTCSLCGYADSKNRDGSMFLCLSCSHSDNADINASKNILDRFLSGPYGAGCKALV